MFVFVQRGNVDVACGGRLWIHPIYANRDADGYCDCNTDTDTDCYCNCYGYADTDCDRYRDSHGYDYTYGYCHAYTYAHCYTAKRVLLGWIKCRCGVSCPERMPWRNLPDLRMPTARFRYAVSIATGPRAREYAQPFVAPELELEGDPAEYQVAIPAAGVATIWDAAAVSGLPANFRLLILRSDLEVEIEFTTQATQVADAKSSVTLQAGNIPFVLGSDKARAGVMTTPLTTGTVGCITKIRGKNGDAATTAYVQVVIGA